MPSTLTAWRKCVSGSSKLSRALVSISVSPYVRRGPHVVDARTTHEITDPRLGSVMICLSSGVVRANKESCRWRLAHRPLRTRA